MYQQSFPPVLEQVQAQALEQELAALPGRYAPQAHGAAAAHRKRARAHAQ
jgi:hypothetical protein